MADITHHEINRARRSLSTINLKKHSVRYGIFPRHRIGSGDEDSFSLFAQYESTLTELHDSLTSYYGIAQVEIETGFFAPRLFESTGASLLSDYAPMEQVTIRGQPDMCTSWKQRTGGSLFVHCTTAEKHPSTYAETKLWGIINAQSDHATPAATRKPFPGRVWTPLSFRRLHATLGSSVWAGRIERGEQAAPTLDGNDYQWVGHPRFAVVSGYSIKITPRYHLFSAFVTTEPIYYFGILPVFQEF